MAKHAVYQLTSGLEGQPMPKKAGKKATGAETRPYERNTLSAFEIQSATHMN